MSVKLSLPNVKAVVGSTTDVPIIFSEAVLLGSESLAIGFDPVVLEFVDVINHPEVNFFSTPTAAANTGGEVRVGMFNISAPSVGPGAYCVLQFKYKGGSCPIVFNNKQIASNITDGLANPIPVEYEDGSVSLDVSGVVSPTLAATPVSMPTALVTLMTIDSKLTKLIDHLGA